MKTEAVNDNKDEHSAEKLLVADDEVEARPKNKSLS